MDNIMSRGHKILFRIGYGIVLIDLILSCLMMNYATGIWNEPLTMSNFYRNLMLYFLGFGGKGGNLCEDEIQLLKAEFTLKYLQVKIAVVLAVALFCIILSCVLLFGIYKKHSSCCSSWVDLHLLVYFICVLALIFAARFNRESLVATDWIVIWTYAFYRVGSIIAVTHISEEVQLISQRKWTRMLYSIES